MIGDLLAELLTGSIRPRVVHSLPGRARIHVPALQKLPPGSDVSQGAIDKLSLLFPGVVSVSASSISGNILVAYLPAQITERHILNGLQNFGRALLRYRQKLTQLKPDDFEKVLERLAILFQGSDLNLLATNKEVEIPDDIWP